MTDEVVPIDEGPFTPPYPRGGLNGIEIMALDTGDAAAMLEGLRQDPNIEVVAAIEYQFNGGAQAGWLVVLYDPKNDAGVK